MLVRHDGRQFLDVGVDQLPEGEKGLRPGAERRTRPLFESLRSGPDGGVDLIGGREGDLRFLLTAGRVEDGAAAARNALHRLPATPVPNDSHRRSLHSVTTFYLGHYLRHRSRHRGRPHK